MSAPPLTPSTPSTPSTDESNLHLLAQLYNQPPPLPATTPLSSSNPSSPASTAIPPPPLGSLPSIESHLSTCLESLWKCSVIVDEYQPPPPSTHGTGGSVQPFHRQLSTFLTSLQQLDRTARACDDTVPYAVLELMDRGENPDTLTRAYLDAASTRNDAMRGKLFSVKALHDQLEARVKEWEKKVPLHTKEEQMQEASPTTAAGATAGAGTTPAAAASPTDSSSAMES